MLWRRQLCSLRRVRALHHPPVAGGRHTRAQTRQVLLSGARSPCRMTFSLPRQYETGLPVLPRGTCDTPASLVSLNCAQDLFTSTRSSTTLPCGHNVHVHCFNQYARAQPWTRCPLCRRTSMYATTPPPESPPAPHTLRQHVAKSSARHVSIHRPRNRQVRVRLCSCMLIAAHRWSAPPRRTPLSREIMDMFPGGVAARCYDCQAVSQVLDPCNSTVFRYLRAEERIQEFAFR